VDADVVSRMHMSDEQRKIKLKFEEKQRDEARKEAHRNKILKKQVSNKDHQAEVFWAIARAEWLIT
jgi:hypothetical protein